MQILVAPNFTVHIVNMLHNTFLPPCPHYSNAPPI